MRRRMMLVLVLVFVLVMGLLVAPAAAKKPEPVGDQINVLFQDPDTFAADEPFHVIHGWLLPKKAGPLGKYDFELTVDGVFVDEDRVLRAKATPPEGGKGKQLQWLHNFPAGLPAGDYTFVGTWYAPCTDALGWGYEGPCATPNEKVEAYTGTHVVSFLAP